MKFNDYIPNNDNEVRSTILKCLGSSKKIISNNYTRNNFELLKKYILMEKHLPLITKKFHLNSAINLHFLSMEKSL